MYTFETAWNNGSDVTRVTDTFSSFQDAYQSARFRWFDSLQMQDNSPFRNLVEITNAEVGYRTHAFDVVVNSDPTKKPAVCLNVYIINLEKETH